MFPSCPSAFQWDYSFPFDIWYCSVLFLWHVPLQLQEMPALLPSLFLLSSVPYNYDLPGLLLIKYCLLSAHNMAPSTLKRANTGWVIALQMLQSGNMILSFLLPSEKLSLSFWNRIHHHLTPALAPLITVSCTVLKKNEEHISTNTEQITDFQTPYWRKQLQIIFILAILFPIFLPILLVISDNCTAF